MSPVEAKALRRLIAAVEKELERLRELRTEKQSIDVDTAHPRVLGSLLHDFYTGIERLFQKIALELEGGVPKGADWHRELLEDMTLEIRDVRPPVITEPLRKDLDEYLRFRHLFRSLYGFELERDRMRPLMERFDATFAEFERQMTDFLATLSDLAKGLEVDLSETG